MSDTPRPDLDALRKADKALLAQADRHAEVTGALMDKLAELEASLATAQRERDALQADTERLLDAWGESWDCSSDPGHSIMEKAIDAARGAPETPR